MKALKHISALLACLMLSVAGHTVQIRREPGHRIPEYILPTDPDNPALWTRSGSIFTRAAAPGAYAVTDIPREGVVEYPLVLVEFKDLHFTIQDKEALLKRYDRIFNEQGYTDTARYVIHGNVYYGATGSVSDYFRDQSYGLYTPKFKIIGPIRLANGYAYYGKGKNGNGEKIDQLIRDVCDSIIAAGSIDLAGYSRSGTIDQFSVIYAGRGENYNGSDPNTIWPQASQLFVQRKDSALYDTGITHIKYACTCELFWDSDTILDGIGTFCHEFSHTLGLQDFYNTDTSSGDDSETNASMGFWSLMDYGNYENGGFSPVGYTAFEKYSLGWMELEEITYTGTYYLKDISVKPDPANDIHSAYRLNTGSDDQFIILENHIRTGWYKYHGSQGLMVTAVDYSNSDWTDNRINNKSKRYHILPADNNYNRSTNKGDLFPYKFTDRLGTHFIDSISTVGVPQLKAGSSFPVYSLYYITRDGDQISFRASYDLKSGITVHRSQEISLDVTDGKLSVNAPTGSIVTVYDMSGKAVQEIRTLEPTQQISLPKGIWIVRCADKTRKVRL